MTANHSGVEEEQDGGKTFWSVAVHGDSSNDINGRPIPFFTNVGWPPASYSSIDPSSSSVLDLAFISCGGGIMEYTWVGVVRPSPRCAHTPWPSSHFLATVAALVTGTPMPPCRELGGEALQTGSHDSGEDSSIASDRRALRRQ
uniref:Uncharacterized protein n=1 Tax=Oryza glumipatula TaxID=40148 RepID=A0A0E0A138_9ORYZ